MMFPPIPKYLTVLMALAITGCVSADVRAPTNCAGVDWFQRAFSQEDRRVIGGPGQRAAFFFEQCGAQFDAEEYGRGLTAYATVVSRSLPVVYYPRYRDPYFYGYDYYYYDSFGYRHYRPYRGRRRAYRDYDDDGVRLRVPDRARRDSSSSNNRSSSSSSSSQERSSGSGSRGSGRGVRLRVPERGQGGGDDREEP